MDPSIQDERKQIRELATDTSNTLFKRPHRFCLHLNIGALIGRKKISM